MSGASGMDDAERRGAVRRLLADPGPVPINWFQHRPPRAHEIGIVRAGPLYRVYAADERAAPGSSTLHLSRRRAVDSFLDSVRARRRWIDAAAALGTEPY